MLNANTEKLLKKLITEYSGDINSLQRDIEIIASSLRAKRPIKATGEVLVELKAVSKNYKLGRQDVQAITNANIKVYKGEIVALVGPSGSGKSTIMNIIGGLDKPTRGEVLFEGRSIAKLSDAKLSEYRNKNIGFVFQFFYLQPFLKLDKNVQIPGIFSRMGKDKRRAMSDKYITSVGLADRANHLPKELSGGQMQRAAIARALINQPKLILADEPTGNLDSKNGLSVIEQFQKARDELGTTILLVTHDQKIASLADRVIEVCDGEVAEV